MDYSERTEPPLEKGRGFDIGIQWLYFCIWSNASSYSKLYVFSLSRSIQWKYSPIIIAWITMIFSPIPELSFLDSIDLIKEARDYRLLAFPKIFKAMICRINLFFRLFIFVHKVTFSIINASRSSAIFCMAFVTNFIFRKRWNRATNWFFYNSTTTSSRYRLNFLSISLEAADLLVFSLQFFDYCLIFHCLAHFCKLWRITSIDWFLVYFAQVFHKWFRFVDDRNLINKFLV